MLAGALQSLSQIAFELLAPGGEIVVEGTLKTGDYLERWLEGVKRRRAYQTYRGRRTAIKNHLLPRIGNIALARQLELARERGFGRLRDEAGFLAATLRGFDPFSAARVANAVAASCVTALSLVIGVSRE